MTEGNSVDPKGEMGHRSDRRKVAREEEEKLKDDAMEVDVDGSQGERECSKKNLKTEGDSGRIRKNTRIRLWDDGHQSGRSRRISLESGESQDHVRETLAISQEEERRRPLCQAPLVNQESHLLV